MILIRNSKHSCIPKKTDKNYSPQRKGFYNYLLSQGGFDGSIDLTIRKHTLTRHDIDTGDVHPDLKKVSQQIQV